MNPRLASLALSCVVLTGGCKTARGPLDLESDDPAILVPSITDAVERSDKSAVDGLVDDLESDDPGVRMFAETGLRRLTGTDMGYRHYASPADRAVAVARWREHLAQAATRPATQPGAVLGDSTP
jgi:hypothetical protein